MLALHLLQNCMVYINTLMLQQVLAQPKWADKLTPRDLRALTPLIWDHVNPYGRFLWPVGVSASQQVPPILSFRVEDSIGESRP